jgi:hypothetical protein
MLHANTIALQQKQAASNGTDAPSGPGALGTAITHFGQQASFGFSDELAGGFDALVAQHFGGDPIMAYHRGVQEHQAYLRAGAEANPTAALTGDAAGVASQLLYPAAIAKAPRVAAFLGEATKPVGGIASFWKLGAGAAATTTPVAVEAGLNAAGHSEGSPAERAGLGALVAGITAKHVFPWAVGGLGLVKGGRFAADMWRRAGEAVTEGSAAGPTTAGASGAAEAAPPMSAAEERIRAALAKSGAQPDAIERSIARMKATVGNPLYDASAAQQALVDAGAHPATATMTAARNAQQVPVGTSAAEAGGQPTLPWAEDASRTAYNLSDAAGQNAKDAATRAGGFARRVWMPGQGL